MKKPIVIAVVLTTLLLMITGCDSKKSSQIITLYKGSIASGKSVINFVDYDDPNGAYAQGFCEDMKKLYEQNWHETYYCSSVQFKEYVPNLKWNLSD
jgi:hypothetical protein